MFYWTDMRFVRIDACLERNLSAADSPETCERCGHFEYSFPQLESSWSCLTQLKSKAKVLYKRSTVQIWSLSHSPSSEARCSMLHSWVVMLKRYRKTFTADEHLLSTLSNLGLKTATRRSVCRIWPYLLSPVPQVFIVKPCRPNGGQQISRKDES